MNYNEFEAMCDKAVAIGMLKSALKLKTTGELLTCVLHEGDVITVYGQTPENTIVSESFDPDYMNLEFKQITALFEAEINEANKIQPRHNNGKYIGLKDEN